MADNTFTQLTIDGQVYEPRDTTKVPLPTTEGLEGQVLTKQGDNIVWSTIEIPEIPDIPETVVGGLSYITSFEVYAHTSTIPVGYSEALGDISVAIPANTVHGFTLRSEQLQDDMNVIIDWGDGSTTDLKTITPTGSEGDYRYTVAHDYNTTGKFIYTITGNTYFGIIPAIEGDNNNNLICRAFDVDLPISIHLSNYANFCLAAKRLVKANVFNSMLNVLATNVSNLFANCPNLKRVEGFSARSNIKACVDVFLNDANLEYTDFRLPAMITNPGDNEYLQVYDGCSKLAVDINNLLPANGFFGKSKINMGYTFRNCSSLTGTVPAKLLWEDTSVDWVGTPDNSGVGPFVGCSDALRAQIPVSWGGTNASIDDKLAIKGETDYTAFEIYPNSKTIEAGTHENLGTITTAVRNQVAFYFNMVSDKAQSDLDVIIDWGDGYLVNIRTLTATTYAEASKAGHYTWMTTTTTATGYSYQIFHNYSKVDQRLTVKIYGKTYSNINFNTVAINNNANNLICRVFDEDLPIASHLKDFSGMCMYAKRLVYVNLQFIVMNMHRYNMSNLFTGCPNIIRALFADTLSNVELETLGLAIVEESYSIEESPSIEESAIEPHETYTIESSAIPAVTGTYVQIDNPWTE